jgi:hypothetical protein
MKTRFYFLLSSCVVIIAACQKEPPKGNYSGRFEGSYEAENQKVTYTTYYDFEIIKSTKTEIHLKEQDSQMTSILQKKSNDSIAGRIGFGKIYNPSGGPAINTISVSGKYYKEDAKSYISGTFSTIFSIGEKECPSEGIFVLQSY